MKTDELMGALLTQTPQQKASVLVKALHQVFLELEEEERRQLLIDLTADDSQDKISSMVHL